MPSATAAPSMIAPSTMLSGGTGSMPKATTFHPLPAAFSSTAFTALEPMSRPTTAFDLPRPNTTVCPFELRDWASPVPLRDCTRMSKTGANGENCGPPPAPRCRHDYGSVRGLQEPSLTPSSTPASMPSATPLRNRSQPCADLYRHVCSAAAHGWGGLG